MAREWSGDKVLALQAMDVHAQKIHGRPIMSLLEAGVAFTHYLEGWERFPAVYYMGVDFRDSEVLTAQMVHPGRLFDTISKPQLLSGQLLQVMPPDAIVLLDPTMAFDADVCGWAFAAPVEYIVWACWWNTPPPRGWDVVHRSVRDEAVLAVLARNS